MRSPASNRAGVHRGSTRCSGSPRRWTASSSSSSGAAEPRLALLEEGGDALLEVLGLRRGGLKLSLELELLLEGVRRCAVEQPLRHADATGRHCRELACNLGGPPG